MKKIAILGSGALGSSLANVLMDTRNIDVMVYGIDKQELKDLSNGKNSKYFPNTNLNKMNVTDNLEIALKDADYILIAIPSKFIANILKDINRIAQKEFIIINGSKGFLNDEQSIYTGIKEFFKNNEKFKGVASLTGPSFAEEIANKQKTAIAVVNEDEKICYEIQEFFRTSYFKLYAQTDVIGSELGGIYKNVLAIGSGILHGMGLEMNTIAVYLTRGMKEMQVLNKFLGGKNETIYGLTGLGDLLLTSLSNKSRNFSYGYAFAQNPELANKQTTTREGLIALEKINQMRNKFNLYLPIAEMLIKILQEKIEINEAIQVLWDKEVKQEF